LIVPKLPLPVAAVALVLLLGGAVMASKSNNYQVSVVMPNANNLFKGSSVMREGYKAGTVKDIKVMGDKAKLTLALDDSFGVLHDGVRVQILWKGLLGERLVTLDDGPKTNMAIPSGSLLTDVASEPVEISEVLSALDKPTRVKVNTLVKNLNATLSGHESDMQAALVTAGPAVKQLGAVLDDLGADGEAIRQILTQSNRTIGILAERQATLGQVVRDLGDMTENVAQEHQELGQTLEELPGVLNKGEKTLNRVPDAVDETVPLLKDLKPATKRLTKTSKHLKPVLQDLRPAVHDLRPSLVSLARLLNETPALMDSGVRTFPDLNTTLTKAQPGVKFLRPYTPEVAGWFANWTSAGGLYDSNGHFGRFHVLGGAEAVIPGVTRGPGVTQNLTPKPGNPVGQPWEDAYGDGLR
jgi:phospholipid/cholesterol/gamma-HCH transport system substrate-binding protein